jgi:CRP-like cAMP-binding protein
VSQQFDKRTVLAAHPFFKGIAPAIVDSLVSRAVIRKVKKGAVLFRKGDPGTTLYAVLSGAVRISAPSRQGQDAIFNLIPSGEIFGEIALLDGGARTADAVVIEDSELMLIERRDFVPLVRDNPELAMKLVEIVCTRLRKTTEQVEDVMFHGLPTRLAKTLLQLSERSASAADGKLRLTQRDLGQVVGVSRESVNKLLRDWQRRKWLKLERGGLVILAPVALAGIVSDEAETAGAKRSRNLPT